MEYSSNLALPANTKAVKSLFIDRLFGHYTYSLPNLDKSNQDFSKLLILYGDNGSGKTTILRLLYHLLAAKGNRGHKSQLARTPFKEFTVNLGDNTRICARRDGESLVGSYTVEITKSTGTVISIELVANEELSIKASDQEEEKYEQFISIIKSLDIALYYLSDDRRAQSSFAEIEDLIEYRGSFENFNEEARLRFIRGEILQQGRDSRRVGSSTNVRLELALDHLIQWVREQARVGANVGSANTNNIYTSVISQLNPESWESVDDQKIYSLVGDLESLAAESLSYTKFDLFPPFEIQSLISVLKDIPLETRPIALNILAPYVNGIRARMTALSQLRDILTTFSNSLAEFYVGKEVTFHLKTGLKISLNGTEEELEPTQLSSGEKQLLLLLTNTIVARDKASIFIIDEPEISLNVKWQRQLVDTLLKCVQGSSVQFILATHSVELLTKHRHHVSRLNNSINGR